MSDMMAELHPLMQSSVDSAVHLKVSLMLSAWFLLSTGKLICAEIS